MLYGMHFFAFSVTRADARRDLASNIYQISFLMITICNCRTAIFVTVN